MSSLEDWSLENDLTPESVVQSEPIFQPPPELENTKKKSGTVELVLIVYLVLSIIFSAMSARGMALWFCENNWDAFTLFICNLGNNLLLGIPGFIKSIYSDKNKFVLQAP